MGMAGHDIGNAAARLVRAFGLGCALVLALVPALGATSGAAQDTLRVVNGEHVTALTRERIEAVGLHDVTLETPFDARTRFSGVALADLLDAAGLRDARRLRLVALDGYTVVLERHAIDADAPMLVSRQDGAPLTIATKGPYRVIYPIQAAQAMAGTAATVSWVWHLTEIRRVD